MRTLQSLCSVMLVTAGAFAADGETKFRTDGGDEKLPWYQIQPGVFPPEGSAHYFAGELIGVDHLNRQFVLRTDRTDAQRRSHWDLPVSVEMLPFGAVYYHGAPASLADIPLGTHMHGHFYEKDPKDKSKPMAGWHQRVSPEGRFTRCLRLEDDFSYRARRNQLWRIDEVNHDENKLVATLLTEGKPAEKPETFDLTQATRVWKASGIATHKDLAKGQTAQLNITWATLYGAGRALDIWIDKASRKLATEHQLEKHRLHTRERGLPGWIDAVDNQKRILTITFFDNVDAELLADLKENSSAAIAVARHTLMTYDPVNDRKSGSILKVAKVADAIGSSGVQIQVKPSMLLEGFRPKRIVRVYPSGWKVIALPKEEQFFGLDE